MVDSDFTSFSKKQFNDAGVNLRKSSSNLDLLLSLDMVSIWRSAHIHPLNVFNNRLDRILKNNSDIYSSAFAVQRLKRVSSIKNKLNRFTTRLTQMQDVAGCRVVLPTVKSVQEFYTSHFINGSLKHDLVRVDDYISKPKLKNGYRSLHLVYKYFSDKKNKQKYNGLFVEIQLRTKLQHIWATAVETVSFFSKKDLKLDEGDSSWEYFFKLVSSAFAYLEGTPLVRDISYSREELFSLIKSKEKELDVINKLSVWSSSIREVQDLNNDSNYSFFLLKLDLNLKELKIIPYSKRQEKKAIKDYDSYERDISGNTGYDVVLVGSDSVNDLEKAYSNYFLDTRKFIHKLKLIISKVE